jgi:predicted hotdog family 3-hydroxylacyl-ACP dehydratase
MTGRGDLGRERLLELIPHAGGMCLLDRVVGYSSEEIHCIARSHRDSRHPLRSREQLSALHLAEYAAQAMAAHGALLAEGGAQPGMLAALREVRLNVARLDDIDGELAIHAIRRLIQTRGSLYDFTVHGGGRLLGEGRIAIALLGS